MNEVHAILILNYTLVKIGQYKSLTQQDFELPKTTTDQKKIGRFENQPRQDFESPKMTTDQKKGKQQIEITLKKYESKAGQEIKRRKQKKEN